MQYLTGRLSLFFHCLVSILLLFFSYCKKETYYTKDAIVKDIQGDCGHVIYVDYYIYQPRNLPDSLKIDSLRVTLTFKLLERAPECYGNVPVEDMIHIQHIRRKL
jgi:hypothetical protein